MNGKGPRVARAIALAFIGILSGCAGPPRTQTTFLRAADLVEMTDRMAASFAETDAIASRTPSSPPWVVSIDRVVNHTNQVIPDREKWLYIGRLRTRLAEARVGADMNITWVVPPERWPIIAEELGRDEPAGLRLPPTHVLTATFSSLTNTSGAGRSDAYLCRYELVDLDGGRIVWSDAWEVKRAIGGRTYD